MSKTSIMIASPQGIAILRPSRFAVVSSTWLVKLVRLENERHTPPPPLTSLPARSGVYVAPTEVLQPPPPLTSLPARSGVYVAPTEVLKQQQKPATLARSVRQEDAPPAPQATDAAGKSGVTGKYKDGFNLEFLTGKYNTLVIAVFFYFFDCELLTPFHTERPCFSSYGGAHLKDAEERIKR
jgi:hypothetical protein